MVGILSDLKKRIQAILAVDVVHERSVAKKAALTAVALIAPVVIGMISGRVVRAQSQLFVPRESLPGGGLMAPQILPQSKAPSTAQFDVA